MRPSSGNFESPTGQALCIEKGDKTLGARMQLLYVVSGVVFSAAVESAFKLSHCCWRSRDCLAPFCVAVVPFATDSSEKMIVDEEHVSSRRVVDGLSGDVG